MPWTSATASTKTAVASRNTTVSPAIADIATNVPMPGKAAAEPTAAPLAITAAR